MARSFVTADLTRWGRGRRDGEVVETIEDFAGMKGSRSGLFPDRTVINYNTSIPLAAREALSYMRITLVEHYRQMGFNALLTSLKLNYAAQGSPEMRLVPGADRRTSEDAASAIGPPEVSI
jgi:V/A-type H+/Na+-transporting ATPase subunit A